MALVGATTASHFDTDTSCELLPAPSMDALGIGGLRSLFPFSGPHTPRPRPRPHRPRRSSSSTNARGGGGGTGTPNGWPLSAFPLKQAAIAACLTSTGDTIAQINSRLAANRSSADTKDITSVILSDHDWLRALRMASYGFLLYGPGSYAWYQFLDRCMPKQTFFNLSAKVVLNQIILGPCVIAVVFAWNNLWLRRLSELPTKYQKDALPTLLYGFRFWIPVSILNFGVVPLAARVAFMSTCSIFWNFYLSSTMSK